MKTLYFAFLAVCYACLCLIPVAALCDERAVIGVSVTVPQEKSERQNSAIRASLSKLVGQAPGCAIRFEIPWMSVESEKGKPDYSAIDEFLKSAEAGKHQITFCLTGPCAWQEEAPNSTERRSEFVEFFQRMVERYKDKVKTWEVWSRPNMASDWPKPNAEDYARLVNDISALVKKADTEARIITCSTYGPDTGFIKSAVGNASPGSFDFVGVQPYSLRGGPMDQRLMQVLDLVHRASVTKDVQSAGIVISAVGWSADDDKTRTDLSAYLVQSFVIGVLNGVKQVFWNGLIDSEDCSGLFDSEGNARPALQAFSLVARHLNKPSLVGPLVVHNDVVAWYFITDAGSVIAAWNTGAGQPEVGFPLDEKSKVFSSDGSIVSPINGKITLKHLPVLITTPAPMTTSLATRGRRQGFRFLSARPLLLNGSLDDPRGAGESVFAWEFGGLNGSQKDGIKLLADGRSGRGIGFGKSSDASWESWPVPVRAGATYELKGWYKSSVKSGKLQAAVCFYNGPQNVQTGMVYSDALAAKQSWTNFTVKAISPADTVFARVRLLADNIDGESVFDDLSLEMLQEN